MLAKRSIHEQQSPSPSDWRMERCRLTASSMLASSWVRCRSREVVAVGLNVWLSPVDSVPTLSWSEESTGFARDVDSAHTLVNMGSCSSSSLSVSASSLSSVTDAGMVGTMPAIVSVLHNLASREL